MRIGSGNTVRVLFNYRIDLICVFFHSRILGDVFHVSALGSHLVFLNTSQAVQDIFVKRFLNYADRTPLHMINDL